MDYKPPTDEFFAEFDSLVALYQKSNNDLVFEIIRLKLVAWVRQRARFYVSKHVFPGDVPTCNAELWSIIASQIIPSYDYRRGNFLKCCRLWLGGIIRDRSTWGFHQHHDEELDADEEHAVAPIEPGELSFELIQEFLDLLKPPVLMQSNYDSLSFLLTRMFESGSDRTEAVSALAKYRGMSVRRATYFLEQKNFKKIVQTALANPIKGV